MTAKKKPAAKKAAPKKASKSLESSSASVKAPYKAHLRSFLRHSVNQFAGEDQKVRRDLNKAVRTVQSYADLCDAFRGAGKTDEEIGAALESFFDKA